MFKIAINGKANSGKNTVTKLLAKSIGLSNWKDSAFAVPIKEALIKMYPSAVREHLFGPSYCREYTIPGTNVTYRQVLLELGAFARKHDSDHWVKILVEDYQNTIGYDAYFCSDLRFLNEMNYLEREGFYLVRVRRPNASAINDISETEQDGISDSRFHLVLENNGTFDDLNQLCRAAVPSILEYFKK